MDILGYFKQLSFHTLFSESQYFSTYSQVKMSIFLQKKTLFETVFCELIKNYVLYKKNHSDKKCSLTKNKKKGGFKIFVAPIQGKL